MNKQFDVFQRDLQRQTILTVLENKIKEDVKFTPEEQEKICQQVKQLAFDLWGGKMDRREFISRFRVITEGTVPKKKDQ